MAASSKGVKFWEKSDETSGNREIEVQECFIVLQPKG